ncbi:hypothetical protein GCM10027159_15700 [Lysobacter terrae]
MLDQKTGTVRTEASPDDIAALRRAGIAVRIDAASTRRMHTAEAALRDQALKINTTTTAQGDVGTQSISGFTCYRTVEETYTTMNSLAAARPDLARVIDIGPSWLRSRNPSLGYRMRVLRLNNTATDATLTNKPNMVVFASIHAREYTPAETLTRFGEWLVNNYGSDDEATWLLDNFRFHLVLQANPDGRKKAEAGLSWRKNVDTSNGVCSTNAYGVDLNRNFPYRWHTAPGGSSSNACLGNYRGPSAASEPETSNLLSYVAGVPDSTGTYIGGVLPDRRGNTDTSAAPSDYRGMFIDLHSFARMVLWPWSYTTAPTANATPLQTLGRRLAWFNGYSPQQWTGMTVADGTTTDSMYGLLGAPSYTIEMGYAFFEDCGQFLQDTLPRNLAALRYAARNLHAPYAYPSGPDTTSLSVSPRSVSAGTPVTVTAVIDDTPFNNSSGTEPVQRITSATVYRDQRPWTSGATAIAMSANDGAFDEPSETVSVHLSTSGLSQGVHTLFVRGRDASGRPGTPQAVRFTITP